MRSRVARGAGAFFFLMGCMTLHLVLRHYYLSMDPNCAPALADVNAYLNAQSPPDVLLAGNSHVVFGLSPSRLGDAMSVACLKETYTGTRYKIEYLFGRGSPPKKAVVLQLDLHSFAASSMDSMRDPMSALFVDHLELARRYGAPLECAYAWIRFDQFPYAGKGIEYFAGPSAERAGGAQTDPFARRFSEAANPVQDVNWSVSVHLPEGTPWRQQGEIDSFQSIARMCRENGLALVWIRFPVTRAYQEAMEQRLPVEEWTALADSLAETNPNVVLLDYHDAYFGKDELFFDSNHLNGEGILRFTATVRGELTARGVMEP